MSHFSVCVEIPGDRFEDGHVYNGEIDDLLEKILAPYCESTEDPCYLTFEDRTSEIDSDFKTGTMDGVRFPDGSACSIYDSKFCKEYKVCDGVIKKKGEDAEYHEVSFPDGCGLIHDMPISELYSYEGFCENYCGYRKNSSGVWGCYYNPNATWDWWETGGRFRGKLVVRNGTPGVLPVIEKVGDVYKPVVNAKGFQYVSGAFKKDICWTEMMANALAGYRKSYNAYVKAFSSGKVENLDTIASITDEGIVGWGQMLYLKGETLDEFLNRNGVSPTDQYVLSTYAYVDGNGEWHGSGEMGWFGLSSNDMPERAWHDEMQSWLSGIEDDAYIVIVDCHI